MTLLLHTSAHPQMVEHAHPNGGRLIQPRHYSSIEDTARVGIPWAADNDAFNGFDEDAYVRMLDTIAGLPGCLFVVAPDVVGDQGLTDLLYDEWWWEIAGRSLPVAYVVQEPGCEYEPRGVPWSRMDALFIGCVFDTNKLSKYTALLAREAHRRGVWVHWGRVNSERRIRWIKSTGACDSFDGSGWAKWRDANLPRGLRAAAQEVLDLGTAA